MSVKILNKITKLTKNNPRIFVSVLVVTAIGVIATILSNASSFSIMLEPEKGALIGAALTKSGTDASNVQYVEFGSKPVSGECSPYESEGCVGGNSSGKYFKESFNLNPPEPQSVMNREDLLPRWFAQPVLQGPLGWALKPDPMLAQHTSTCGKPVSWPGGMWDGSTVSAGHHLITTYADTVYQCKDHIMTAQNPSTGGTSSSEVVLKPNHVIDFNQIQSLPNKEAIVRVDVSTSSPSMGDWWEWWITPWEDQLIAPNEHWFHHAGPPKNGMMMKIADFPGSNQKFWHTEFFDNFNEVGAEKDFWLAPDIRPIVSNSDTRRDTYEVRISETKVKLYVENSSTGELVFVKEHAIPRNRFFGDKAVVQFMQASYEPEKNSKFGCPDDPNKCPVVTIPATWHWDDVEIYPSAEYEMIGAKEYMVWFGSNSKQVTLNRPAPANAKMLFSGQSWGNSPQVSFDGGKTYKNATYVRPPNDPPGVGFGGQMDLLTYIIDVPAGQTSVIMKGCCGYSGDQEPEWSWSTFNFHVVALKQ